jgi:hypothetical protein
MAYRYPEENELTLLTSIDVGGRADALVIDSCRKPGEVIFFNRTAGAVRFLSETTHTLSPDSIPLSTLDNNRWIAFDRGLCLAYVVTSQQRWNFGTIPWREVHLHVVQNHAPIGTISVNAARNLNLTEPPDSGYYLTGLALKQSNSEASNPVRLIIDDTRHGRIDVVDLNTEGTAAVNPIQRFAYDERNLNSSGVNMGNSLALEAKHETLSVDDLTSTDHLYIADPNYVDTGSGRGYIRVVRINHPLQTLNAAMLPEVNLTGILHFYMGKQGLDIAGPRDRLYVASAMSSFNTGRIAKVNTTNHASISSIDLTYEDAGEPLVDWYDTRRVFIATSDYYTNPTPGLYLHLVYDGTVVDSLLVKSNYDRTNNPFRHMAFDPRNRRLYMGVGTEILVVQVNYGLPPLVEPCEDCPKIYLPLLRR